LVMSSTSLLAVAPARADSPEETIVIIDSAPPRPSEDSSASASVITVDRTPRSAETMPDLLDDLPGVSVSRLGGIGAPALLSLRGSTWDQVSVYLDGVNLNLAAGGGVDVSTLPVGDLARVEIYRGVTPIAYGGSAIGGVLAVETKRPQTDGATLEFGSGSFGTWLGGGSVTFAREDYGIYVGLHSLKTAGNFDFVDDKGTAFNPDDDETIARHNNRLHEHDAVIRGFAALPGPRELSLLVLGFDRDQGLPGYPRYATMQSSLQTRRAIGSIAYTSHDELGTHSLLRAQLYGYGLEQRFRDPLSEIAVAPTDARDRTLALGGTVRASRAVSSWLQPAALLDIRRESFVPHDLIADERGAMSTRLLTVAGAEAALRKSGFTVTPSLRLEMSRDVSAGRGDTGMLVAPDEPLTRTQPIVRVAITKPLRDDLMLRSNVGRYARLPSFLELYGNNGFIVGNRELTPERGLTADVGGAYTGSQGPLALTADAAAFAVLIDDLIQFQQNAYGVARARNIGHARVLGFESSAELRCEFARLYAQATLTDARDRSDSAAAADRQLPYRPRVHLTARPELRHALVGGTELGAYVEVDFTSGNFVDPANLVQLPSRMLLGAGASLGLDHGHVRFIASANNLTDASVSDVLAYPLPGRAFFLSMALTTDLSVKEN
ncbi:MAG TPA: TonB-dependent receptor, partial [Kofleriaceae bacterium]|nr:TonB-dependent receptor [Kofleriaceae bacterium]